MSQVDFARTIETLLAFSGDSLTKTLSGIERSIGGVSAESCRDFLDQSRASPKALEAAAEMKRVAGQVNVTIHALGILLCLPQILEPGEVVVSASLGAGNTGRKFDLETNLRVAEFKFITWRGGPESIRQNGVFKDFVMLEEYPTDKRKYLYLTGTEHALKFFNGGRALDSVLSRAGSQRVTFAERFGDRYRVVRDYYADHADRVSIVDISPWISVAGAIDELPETIEGA